MRLSLPGEENGVLEKFLYCQGRPDIYIACCKVIYNVVKLIHKHTKYKVIKVHVNITNITQTEITKSFVSTVLIFGKSFFFIYNEVFKYLVTWYTSIGRSEIYKDIQ